MAGRDPAIILRAMTSVGWRLIAGSGPAMTRKDAYKLLYRNKIDASFPARPAASEFERGPFLREPHKRPSGLQNRRSRPPRSDLSLRGRRRRLFRLIGAGRAGRRRQLGRNVLPQHIQQPPQGASQGGVRFQQRPHLRRAGSGEADGRRTASPFGFPRPASPAPPAARGPAPASLDQAPPPRWPPPRRRPRSSPSSPPPRAGPSAGSSRRPPPSPPAGAASRKGKETTAPSEAFAQAPPPGIPALPEALPAGG